MAQSIDHRNHMYCEDCYKYSPKPKPPSDKTETKKVKCTKCGSAETSKLKHYIDRMWCFNCSESFPKPKPSSDKTETEKVKCRECGSIDIRQIASSFKIYLCKDCGVYFEKKQPPSDKFQEFDKQLEKTLNKIGDMLRAKNRAYGNSALDPVRIFSKADTLEQIYVRIDDKLSRLKRGSAAGEDVELDLIGYLVLAQMVKGSKGK